MTTQATSVLPVGPSAIDGYASFENFQIDRDFFRALRRSRRRAAFDPLIAVLSRVLSCVTSRGEAPGSIGESGESGQNGELVYRVPTLKGSDLPLWIALYRSIRENGYGTIGGRLVGRCVYIEDAADARVRLALGGVFGYDARDIVVARGPAPEVAAQRDDRSLRASLASATGNGSWR